LLPMLKPGDLVALVEPAAGSVLPELKPAPQS
jgi:hypothetical protein